MKKFLLASLLFFSVFSFAADEKDGEEGKPNVKKVFKKAEQHKFSGLMLQGQLKKPDLSYIYKRRGLKSEQIVNIPENFNEEIRQGAGQF